MTAISADVDEADTRPRAVPVDQSPGRDPDERSGQISGEYAAVIAVTDQPVAS